uniref:Uncharacterized protein n=1 Tax=Dunaliella tertiolecta TaxID=3047 RepID=A0A7S3QXU4_DUNTE
MIEGLIPGPTCATLRLLVVHSTNAVHMYPKCQQALAKKGILPKNILFFSQQESTSIVDVQDGAEPPFFTQHFLAWDTHKRATIPDVYKEKLKQQEAGKQEESS